MKQMYGAGEYEAKQEDEVCEVFFFCCKACYANSLNRNCLYVALLKRKLAVTYIVGKGRNFYWKAYKNREVSHEQCR